MKAKLPPRLSAKENAAIDREIRKQAVERVAEYYLDFDVQDAYVLHTVFGFEAKRIEKFFEERERYRADLHKRYGGEDYENMAEIAMRSKLMDAGIDVRRMFDKNAANRFEVRVQEGDKQVICR